MNISERRPTLKHSENRASKRGQFLQRLALSGVLFAGAAAGVSARAEGSQGGLIPAPVTEPTFGCPFGVTPEETQVVLEQTVGGRAPLWEIQDVGTFRYTADDDAAELMRPKSTSIYDKDKVPLTGQPVIVQPHQEATLDCNFLPGPKDPPAIFLKRQ